MGVYWVHKPTRLGQQCASGPTTNVQSSVIMPHYAASKDDVEDEMQQLLTVVEEQKQQSAGKMKQLASLLKDLPGTLSICIRRHRLAASHQEV